MRTTMAALACLLTGSVLAQSGPAAPVPPMPPPAAASAESPEQAYARGYQRGFADGAAQAQQQRQRGARPRACMKVKVLDARWAEDRAECDATRAAAEIANGRVTSSVPASNNLCGDPAPGRRKTLHVEFACGEPAYCPTEIRTASAPEGRHVQLNCAQ